MMTLYATSENLYNKPTNIISFSDYYVQNVEQEEFATEQDTAESKAIVWEKIKNALDVCSTVMLGVAGIVIAVQFFVF